MMIKKGEVAKRFRWNITDSILKPNYLTLGKTQNNFKGLKNKIFYLKKKLMIQKHIG